MVIIILLATNVICKTNLFCVFSEMSVVCECEHDESVAEILQSLILIFLFESDWMIRGCRFAKTCCLVQQLLSFRKSPTSAENYFCPWMKSAL